MLVIVDVLSFTTAVDVALGRGGRVLPVRRGDAPALAAARAAGAVIAGERKWTLRPSSLVADGHATDVELAAAVGDSSCAPVLRDGALTNRLSS